MFDVQTLLFTVKTILSVESKGVYFAEYGEYFYFKMAIFNTVSDIAQYENIKPQRSTFV